MKLIKTIIAMLIAMLCCSENCYDGAVCVQVADSNLFDELPVILRAAERNDCRGNDLLILLAIRKAENGGPGREFGILHPRCQAAIAKRSQDSLDIQAGWAAATIVKNRERWNAAGKPGDFITFLANRYCPVKVDEQGNINFKNNVRYFYHKFKKE